MKRILIIGGWGTTHIRRFLTVLCRDKNSDLIIDAFDPRIVDMNSNECGVNKVYRMEALNIMRKVYSIRKVGTFLFEKAKKKRLNEIIKQNRYDLINIHQIPTNARDYIEIAHRCGIKTMLTPFGSDVLRVSKIFVPSLKKAFKESDFISANMSTGFSQIIMDKYDVSANKMVDIGYGSETISAIKEMTGKYDKKQLVDILGITYSNFYITCGYTASVAQRHSLMIEAIYANKKYLPDDYCLLIPLSYGTAKEQLKSELSEQCNRLDLRYYIIADYLNNEQVGALRIISDLFIHIQPTDAYNASLQEFLLTGTQCINGKWLEYPSLERFGAPYHICESLDNLPNIIGQVLRKELAPIDIHTEVRKEIEGNAWNDKIKYWKEFYLSV